jgi:hypothetical protein
MRCIRIFDQLGLRDPGGGCFRQDERDRIVGGAVQDQRRHLHRCEFGPEIGLAEGVDTGRGRRDAGLHRHGKRCVDHFRCNRVGRGPLGVEKHVPEQTRKIGPAVAEHALFDAVEHLAVDAAGVVLGFQEIVRGRRHQRRLGDVAALVAREIANDFAAAHGIADQGRIAHAGLLDHGGEVVGKGVEVITRRGLRGAAETATIVSDHPHARLGQRRGLIIPDIGVERPGMRHHHGAAGSAGILHEQFGAVLGPDFCALGARQTGQR